MPIKSIHMEFMVFYSDIIKKVKCPILHIYAYPYPYGAEVYDFVDKLLNSIKENSNKQLIIQRFDGSHHFHMINPKPTSELILNFLNSQSLTNLSNSKL